MVHYLHYWAIYFTFHYAYQDITKPLGSLKCY